MRTQPATIRLELIKGARVSGARICSCGRVSSGARVDRSGSDRVIHAPRIR